MDGGSNFLSLLKKITLYLCKIKFVTTRFGKQLPPVQFFTKILSKCKT